MEDHSLHHQVYYAVCLCLCGGLAVVNTTFLLIAGAIFSLEGESVGVGSPTEHIKMTEFKLLGIREEI